MQGFPQCYGFFQSTLQYCSLDLIVYKTVINGHFVHCLAQDRWYFLAYCNMCLPENCRQLASNGNPV